MSTDKYIFEKSSTDQHSTNTPYENKIYNYINDLNNSNYQNNSLSLCQIDLGSIYNSKYFNCMEDAFLAVPIVMVYALNNTGTLVPPAAAGTTTAAPIVMSLKNGGWNLIDKIEFELDGKVIEQMNPFANIITTVKLLSQMSTGDLQQYGSMLSFPQLDSVNSMKYISGVGLQNNFVLGNSLQSNITASLNSNTSNDRITKSVQKNNWAVTNGSANGFEQLTTQTQQDQEGRPSFRILNTNYGVYYDTIIIRLKDILDSCNNIPLTRKIQGALRIYFNTGALTVTQASANTIGALSVAFNSSASTFSTTCPFTINQSSGVVGSAVFTQISAGLFIGKAPTTSLLNGVNLGLSNASHPTINGVRLYYSQVELKPQKALEYVTANRSKLITYNSYLTTVINTINASSSYSSIIQSGITNIKGLIVIPLISASVTNYNQYASPVDTCPSTFAPLSLTQLNVQIGGINVLNIPLYYTFENFVEQIAQWENIITDFSLPVGLMTTEFWNNSRIYYIDCSRYNLSDQNTPRNLVLQFNNNNNVSIDCLVFTMRGEQFVLDVETGIIAK